MDIKIFQSIDGAKKATGLAVIIDVFRAFSVQSYLFDSGASKIIPIGDSDIAYKLKKENPDMISVGERHGKILPGFDFGNSPSQISGHNVNNKTIIHTTSAGTQGIVNAKNAKIILGASLVNAKATANYILGSSETDISLVCMGYAGVLPTCEDTLCAEYIKSVLLGEPFDLKPRIEELKTTDGAKFFDKAQQEVFPEKDFYMCTDVDKFNFAIRLNRNSNLEYMEKILL